MDDDRHRREILWLRLSPGALSHYEVIAEVRSRVRRGETLAEAVRAVVAGDPRVALDGKAFSAKTRSVYRWLAAFEKKGLAGLERLPSAASGPSRVLPERLLAFLRSEKAMDRYASVPELLRRACERGIVLPDERIDRTTVYRVCVRMGLPLRRVPSKHEADQRRFAYPHRMMMVISDGKHFRAGARRSRRVALFYLDDASRFGLASVVGTAECPPLFLRGIHRVVERFGFFDSIYLDRGPGFNADDTRFACVRLDAGLILGASRYPEGHGKIERFNQTALSQLLRGLVGDASVSDDLGALELRMEHFLRRYNQTPHESLDGMTPQQRWDADTRALRFPRDQRDLDDRFIVTETRKVSNDNVIPFDGIDYEVPRGHARTRINVYRGLLGGDLSVLHDKHLVRLEPVDLARNAYDRRGLQPPPPDCDESAPTTAAQLAFARDFGPIVEDDGGFSDPDSDKGDIP